MTPTTGENIHIIKNSFRTLFPAWIDSKTTLVFLLVVEETSWWLNSSFFIYAHFNFIFFFLDVEKEEQISLSAEQVEALIAVQEGK